MTFQREDRPDLSDLTSGEAMEPTHPGVILRAEFLEPLGMSAYRLAKEIDVPKNRVTGIVNGERAVTGDTALRLARFFGTSAEFWVNLQAGYELEVARRRHGARILERIEPRSAAKPAEPVARTPRRASETMAG